MLKILLKFFQKRNLRGYDSDEIKFEFFLWELQDIIYLNFIRYKIKFHSHEVLVKYSNCIFIVFILKKVNPQTVHNLIGWLYE